MLSTNGGTKMTENWYWSSTYSVYYVVHMSDGNVNDYYNLSSGTNAYVRPVLASW